MNLRYNSKISYLIKRPKLYEFIREQGIRVSDIISIEQKQNSHQTFSDVRSSIKSNEICYSIIGDKFILNIETDTQFNQIKGQLILKKLGEDQYY